jgi:hypothetical protein
MLYYFLIPVPTNFDGEISLIPCENMDGHWVYDQWIFVDGKRLQMNKVLVPKEVQCIYKMKSEYNRLCVQMRAKKQEIEGITCYSLPKHIQELHYESECTVRLERKHKL